MNVLNSSSSIISSFQVGTRSFPSFVSVMAGEGASPMNPEQVAPTEAPNVTAPPAGTTPVPDQVNPFAEIMAKAEKQSLEKTLNELLTVVASEKATIPKDLQVTDEEIDNMGPEEVSKLSCKCLVRSIWASGVQPRIASTHSSCCEVPASDGSSDGSDL